jgi:hypothetical protein
MYSSHYKLSFVVRNSGRDLALWWGTRHSLFAESSSFHFPSKTTSLVVDIDIEPISRRKNVFLFSLGFMTLVYAIV